MSAPAYSRQAPSPRYRELVEQYRLMHRRGDPLRNISAAEMFAGQSLPRHTENIRRLCRQHAARTLLDYGSGKGAQYKLQFQIPGAAQPLTIPQYWGVERLVCYDAGYEPYSVLPVGQFDGVVSTDVWEHCPDDDLAWIVDEVFRFATRFVYANVACYPARKTLANGENAHCTIRRDTWWQQLLAAVTVAHPDISYEIHLDQFVTSANGSPQRLRTRLEGRGPTAHAYRERWDGAQWHAHVPSPLGEGPIVAWPMTKSTRGLSPKSQGTH